MPVHHNARPEVCQRRMVRHFATAGEKGLAYLLIENGQLWKPRLDLKPSHGHKRISADEVLKLLLQ